MLNAQNENVNEFNNISLLISVVSLHGVFQLAGLQRPSGNFQSHKEI